MDIMIRNYQKAVSIMAINRIYVLNIGRNQTDRLCPLFDGSSIHSFLHILSYAMIDKSFNLLQLLAIDMKSSFMSKCILYKTKVSRFSNRDKCGIFNK
jgi:hypothetical protein